MIKNKVYIYALCEPITNEIRYIGKTSVKIENRYSQHIYQWKRCKNKLSHLNSWIKHLALKNLKPVLKIIDTVYITDWIEAEMYYIKMYKDLGYNLVNLTNGGEGSMGYKHTKKSINKRLDSLKTSEAWVKRNKRHSEIMKNKHKQKNINFGYGHINEDKRIEIGKNHSLKLKNKYLQNKDCLKNLHSSRKKAIIMYDINENKIMEFESAADAGRFLNIKNTHITKVCKNKAKQTHGFIFKYKN